MDEVRIDLRKIGEDVGNYEVVVGNPAKCIKRLEAAKFLVENGRHERREISGGKNDEQAGGENCEQG